MTRVADAKRLTQHVRSLHPELAWVGRSLVLAPVTHILKSIFFEGGSYKYSYNFRWIINFTFAPYPGLFGFAGQFHNPGRIWDATDPDLDVRFAEIVEAEALPLFHSLQTFDDLCRLTHDDRFCWEPIDDWDPGFVAIHAANGDLARAKAAADKFVTRETGWMRHPDYKTATERIIRTLCPLVYAEDRAGIARWLHEREREIITSWKLDKDWTPTPFPIEEQANAG